MTNKVVIYQRIRNEMEEKLIRTEIDIRVGKKIKSQLTVSVKPNQAQEMNKIDLGLSQLEIMKSNIVSTIEIIDEMVKEEEKLAKIDFKEDKK